MTPDQRLKVMELRHRFPNDLSKPAMPVRLCVVALERKDWDIDAAGQWLIDRGLEWLEHHGYHPTTKQRLDMA